MTVMWGGWKSSGSTKVKVQYLAKGEVNPFLEAMQEAKKGTGNSDYSNFTHKTGCCPAHWIPLHLCNCT